MKILCLLLAMVPTIAMARDDCGTPPSWCRPGYECRPTSCAERDIEAKERLGKGLSSLLVTRPRWFRPFVEGGASWSPVDGRAGVWASGGVEFWRLQASAEISRDEAGFRLGYRREW